MHGQALYNMQIGQFSEAPSQLHRTDAETMLPQEREGGVYEGQEQLRVFKLFRRKYVYHPTQQTFKPLDAMPAHLPRQIFAATEALRAINLAGVPTSDAGQPTLY